MPCEKCKVKFGIITRKKSCYECHRLFCRNCLTKRQERLFCSNCTIFTKRPLSKSDLGQLKPRDLIHYLQSKHISTTGCVEKDDLINLVIAHVNSGASSPRTPGIFSATSSNSGSASGGSSRYGSFHRNGTKNYTNKFDQFKHTCQNFFSNFSDRLNEDGPEGGRQSTSFPTQEEQCHIFTQPRFGSNDVYHSVDPSAGQPMPNGSEYNQQPSSPVRPDVGASEQAAQLRSSESSGTTSGADSSATSSSFSSPRRDASSPSLGGQQSPHSPEGLTQATLDDRIESILALEANGTGGCECCTDDEDEEQCGVVTVSKVKTDPKYVAKSEDDLSSQQSQQPRRSHSYSSLFPMVTLQSPSVELEVVTGPSVETSAATPKATASRSQTPSSSFDDLLADGEGSSSNVDQAIAPDTTIAHATDTDNALITTAASIDDTDQWQIVNTSDANGGDDLAAGGPTLEMATQSDILTTDATLATTTNEAEETSDSISNSVEMKANPPLPPPSSVPVLGYSPSVVSAFTVITRRRSDSFLLSDGSRRSAVATEIADEASHRLVESTTQPTVAPAGLSGMLSSDAIPTSSCPANHTNTTAMCFRCGKRRNGIRRQLKKFRRQLEKATGTEVEKRRQLEVFLNYLERHSKGSSELTDSESITEEASVSLEEEAEGAVGGSARGGPTVQQSHHSYANQMRSPSANDSTVCTTLQSSGNQELANITNVNLSDIQERADLNVLSVKQLKRILMLNRVNFKGCLEKRELIASVERLWLDYKSTTSLEKSDILCKICMDAKIECAFRECGHYLACISCGKVLSECPICRQYIVGLLRIFRA
uniref:RING-type domain-containing protein n=1 Tax=Anopheles farauti TaxID=69004 RepID=A0A182QTP2_9DIPT